MQKVPTLCKMPYHKCSTPNLTYFVNSVQTHLDTLFKITHSSNFNTSVQALMLLQQLSVTKQLASDRYFRTLYESLLDPRLLTSSKQAMYLNLLFRSLKADLNIKRVRAFVKRLTQMITLHQPAFACGALYLIKELEETFPSLQTLIDQPNNSIEDSREIFHDVLDESLNENGNTEGHIAPTDVTPEKSLQNPEYDPRKRDPVYSNAEWTCLWELVSCWHLSYVGYANIRSDSISSTFPSISDTICDTASA